MGRKNETVKHICQEHPDCKIVERCVSAVEVTNFEDGTGKIRRYIKGFDRCKYEEQKLKIIFLDVGGVLNCIGWLNKNEGKSYDQNSTDPSKVELLAEIINRTGAKVVLSSTWRNIRGNDGEPQHPMFDYLVKTLRKCGIEIMDYAPLINNDRPKEIRAWLDNTPFEIESFVSLDDDFREEDYQKQGIFHRLIQTTYWDMDGGLKREHIERAVKLLNE